MLEASHVYNRIHSCQPSRENWVSIDSCSYCMYVCCSQEYRLLHRPYVPPATRQSGTKSNFLVLFIMRLWAHINHHLVLSLTASKFWILPHVTWLVTWPHSGIRPCWTKFSYTSSLAGRSKLTNFELICQTIFLVRQSAPGTRPPDKLVVFGFMGTGEGHMAHHTIFWSSTHHPPLMVANTATTHTHGRFQTTYMTYSEGLSHWWTALASFSGFSE